MAPNEGPFEVSVAENTYRGRMSADAFGITACLYAYRNLAIDLRQVFFTECHELLLAFVRGHTEANAICSAID